MLKFKLNQLIATSIVVAALGSGSIFPALADGTAPLEVPKYRYQGKTIYNTLKSRADTGDEVAKKVLENYKGASISTDLNLAIQAATAYNKKEVASQASGPRPVPNTVKSETATMPTQASGSEVEILTKQLNNAEAQKPVQADTAIVGKYKAFAERCITDVGKLEEEIKT